MPDKERDWIPSVIEEGGGGPPTVQFKGDPGKAYKEGDVYKGAVIDRIGNRSVTVEPWTPEKGYGKGPPITVRMNQYAGEPALTPRAQMRDDAAEMALKKIERGNTIDLDELPWGDSKQLTNLKSFGPKRQLWLDIDPPTEEELEDMEREDRRRELKEAVYPPLSEEEEMEYPEDLRHPDYRDTEPGEYDEQEDTGDVDYIPHEG